MPTASNRTSLRQLIDQLHRETEGRAFPCLLETARDPISGHGVTLVAADPFAALIARGRHVELARGDHCEVFEGDVFDVLRSLLHELRGEEVLALGFLGYDLGALIERLPHRSVDDQGFPDLVIGFYDGVQRVDHATHRVDTIGARRRPPSGAVWELAARYQTEPPSVTGNFTRSEYLETIETARAAIAAGEIYQVNLSQRFAGSFARGPRTLYHRLRDASPAPYAACLEFGNHAVVSSSPEEYLTVSGRQARTTPIKGTRPRGSTPDEDARLREELLTSAKDAAELTMIVDLERNDLGRVCAPGSVRVAEPRRIEAHRTVWHLSATVEGQLEDDVDLVDLIRATFPGGSVTGAPKIRAMELIDELEPTRRGVFTGSLVWMSPDGAMGSSIAIRTMQMHGPLVTFQVGGAIVWDSSPADEYEETLVKARAMAAALGLDLPR